MKVRVTLVVDLSGKCGAPRIDALADALVSTAMSHKDDAMSVRSVEPMWVHLPAPPNGSVGP